MKLRSVSCLLVVTVVSLVGLMACAHSVEEVGGTHSNGDGFLESPDGITSSIFAPKRKK